MSSLGWLTAELTSQMAGEVRAAPAKAKVVARARVAEKAVAEKAVARARVVAKVPSVAVGRASKLSCQTLADAKRE